MRVADLPSAVVDRGLCIGCGMCTAANAGRDIPVIRMEYSEEHDHAVPVIDHQSLEEDLETVCPGVAMDMPRLSVEVHGRVPKDSWLGVYRRIRAAYASDNLIRERAASGGVTTALLNYLFGKEVIDIAYCMVSEGRADNRTGMILRCADDLNAIHGSVYQPGILGAEISALLRENGRFAFVGLPCEIAALEMLKRNNKELADRHVLSIGLFCGGINRFEGINYYLKKFGASLKNAISIDYRYGAWPGKIKLIDANGNKHLIARIRGNSRWNILRYVIGFQGYWMLPRCRMCPDQVSDFADIAVGDPHLPRFRSKKGLGYSAVVLRSRRGEQWYDEAVSDGFIQDEILEREELIESQGYTLDNRRHALAYVRVAKWLRMPVPNLSVYEDFRESSFRHYKYAVVDLLKIRVRKLVFIRWLYIPIQILEYLFITLAPRVFFKRLLNIFSNK
jgi:coenzyme F420 hydrogenase subunit beta